jgi:hypothetical protein
MGEWIHILHQDDVVSPGFYGHFKSALERRDDVGAAFCRHAVIDENDRWLWTSELEMPTPGILPGFIEKISVSQRIQCPSIVVRRAIYEKLGGFRSDLSYAADWEMWIRIAAHYPIWYEPAILAAFRKHSTSWTAACVKSAETVADERRCIAIVQSLLPPAQAGTISRKARELASLRAFGFAEQAIRNHQPTTAFRQIREGLKCSYSPRVTKALLFLFYRVAKGAVRRAMR